jgi:hypothetical protein
LPTAAYIGPETNGLPSSCARSIHRAEVRHSGFAYRLVFGAQITVRTECAADRHAEVNTRRPRTDRGRINGAGILDADLNQIEPEVFYAIDKIKSLVGKR